MELAVGWLLLCMGILITPFPLPVGLLMLVLGVLLLARRSSFVPARIRRLRQHYPELSGRLRGVTGQRWAWGIARTLRDTGPARRD